MRVGVFIKILIGFLMLALSFTYLFFRYMKSIEIDIAVNAEKVISNGLLKNIERKLALSSRDKWKEILNKQNTNNLELISINNLKLNASQQEALNNGNVIVKTGQLIQFLSNVTFSKTAYIKISNSPYVLAYSYTKPIEMVAQYMEPAVSNIALSISETDKTNRAKEIRRLEKLYGYPIHVLYNVNTDIPSSVKKRLTNTNIAYELNKNTTQIGMVYYKFNDGVIKIGPIKYLAITARISDVIEYFIISFFIFCLLTLGVLSTLFIRNLKKIYLITEHFSQGDFNYKKHVAMSSVLHGLYLNIMSMGQRLNELIESNKKMCRFIAHEIRTPLSTIQMATDRLRKKKKGDELVKNQLDSIQEDIVDMNAIVSTFLIYSRMMATDIELKYSDRDIIDWLKNLLKPYQTGALTVDFNDNGLKKYVARFDHTILRYAVTNLITNAMKFADKKIRISVNLNKSEFTIHVDDDGPGLPVEDPKALFSEYTTAVEFSSEGKHIGLGLAIVKKAMILHQGNVSAKQSPLLKGSRFTISIPVFN